MDWRDFTPDFFETDRPSPLREYLVGKPVAAVEGLWRGTGDVLMGAAGTVGRVNVGLADAAGGGLRDVTQGVRDVGSGVYLLGGGLGQGLQGLGQGAGEGTSKLGLGLGLGIAAALVVAVVLVVAYARRA